MLTQSRLRNAHSGTSRVRTEEPQGMEHGAHSSATQQNQQIHPSSNIHQPSQGVSTCTATSQQEECPAKGNSCLLVFHTSFLQMQVFKMGWKLAGKISTTPAAPAKFLLHSLHRSTPHTQHLSSPHVKYLKEQGQCKTCLVSSVLWCPCKDSENITVNVLGKNSAPQFTFLIIFVVKTNHWQLLREQIKEQLRAGTAKEIGGALWETQPPGKNCLPGTSRDHIRLFPEFLGMNGYWLGQPRGTGTAVVAFSAC